MSELVRNSSFSQVVGRGTINILHCFFILKEITDYIFLHQSHTNSATAADLTTYVVEIHTKNVFI